MPRKNRRAPEESSPSLRRPDSTAPGWALTTGFEVRTVHGDKPYRCPGCDLEIRPATRHLVVVPHGALDERRHWHEGCWRVELNQTRGRHRNP